MTATDDAPKKTIGAADVKWPPFNPFVGHPTSSLGKAKILLFGPILIPIRAVGAVLTLALAWLWCSALTLGASDPSDPTKLSPLRRRLLLLGTRSLARSLLFFYGYVWISESHSVKGKAEREKQPPPAAVICNHIGFSELLFLHVRYGCCYVSTEDNKKVPVIGKVAEALGTIFVNKMTKKKGDGGGGGGGGGGGSTTEKVLERTRAPPGKYPPLAICPEGTTTNGRIMIKMHTSVFLAGNPIQPVAVEVPFSPLHGYDPSFSCANLYLHILCLMSQPANWMRVTHLPVHVPTDAERADPKLFANNARTNLARTLGVGTCELEWAHKLQYEPNEKKKELGRKLLAQRNGGVCPPPPVFTQDAFGKPLESNKVK